MYCTEVLVTLLGLFGAPQSFGARAIAPLAPRRYAPDSVLSPRGALVGLALRTKLQPPQIEM